MLKSFVISVALSLFVVTVGGCQSAGPKYQNVRSYSEGLAAVLLGRGAWALWRARRASSSDFARAKQTALWGVLAGFVLPVLFGVLLDATGIRSSAFMVLYAWVWLSLIWMYWAEMRRTDVVQRKGSERG